jgi:hypothetical protein
MGIRLERPDATQQGSQRELEALLDPAKAFSTPADVVRDPYLTLSEKRAILASWASDACAVPSSPSLRAPPLAPQPVSFDDVMDALQALDRLAADSPRPTPHYRRVLRRSEQSAARQPEHARHWAG